VFSFSIFALLIVQAHSISAFWTLLKNWPCQVQNQITSNLCCV